MTCLTPTLHPAVISALTSGKVFPFWSFFPQDFESWLNFYINFINCELYHLSYIKNFLWSVVIYNLVFISGVQQSKSVIYPLFFIFLDSFPIIGHYRVLSRVACAIAASYQLSILYICYYSITKSCQTLCNPKHARFPYPSLSPGVCSHQ